MRRMSRLAIVLLSIVFAGASLGGNCQDNFVTTGSLFKGKTYTTYTDHAGIEPAVALQRLSAELLSHGFDIESVDETAGVLKATPPGGGSKKAHVEITASPNADGARVQLTVALPAGGFATASTRTMICRVLDTARIDPATRYQHPLVSFVKTNETAPDKVSVIESNTKKRIAKIAAGALIGAVAGAAHARLTGGDMAKEAAIGLLAGGAVAFGITKIQDKRLASRDEVMQAQSYEPEQGYRAGVRSVVVTPVTVKPGGTIKVVTTYWALTPDASQSFGAFRYAGISVDGEFLRGFRFSPEPFQFGNGGGEFQTTMEVQLPESVSPGSYGVHWVVDGQSTGGDVEATFNVAG